MPAVLAFLIGKLPKVSGRLRKYSRFRELRTETSIATAGSQFWLNMLWEVRLTLNQRVPGSSPGAPTTKKPNKIRHI